jgi:hypothetical protein
VQPLSEDSRVRIGVLGRIFGKRDGRGGSPEAYVGAFGKHPAWNDHIEDIGIESERLVEAKRSIYVDGIGGNIDSGAWDKLEAPARLEGFGHLFLWSWDDECLVGRMWSSSDGKGRTKYPMAIVAHLKSVQQGVVNEAVLAIEAAEKACRGTQDRGAVIAAVDTARTRIREAIESGRNSGESAFSAREIIQSADMGPNLAGIERVVYQIDRDMGAYLRGSGSDSTTSRLKSIDLRPQHLRVPACVADSWKSILTWQSFMRDFLDDFCPLLVVRREDSPWIDIIVGAPGPGEFFCLRAGTAAVPQATEVPYTIEPALADRVRVWASSQSQPS